MRNRLGKEEETQEIVAEKRGESITDLPRNELFRNEGRKGSTGD